jgi:hypothetical protein
MHSWYIAFQSLFQSFEPYPSKNIVSNAFYPNFRNKRDFRKGSILKMSSIATELTYILF